VWGRGVAQGLHGRAAEPASLRAQPLAPSPSRVPLDARADAAACRRSPLPLPLPSPSPDGTKKAFVRLSPDYDALDVANKIGII
jgi:hypothetical protein